MSTLEEKVMQAAPEELTLMLYEACETNIIQGMVAIKQKKYEQANNHLQRAERIINEFRCTLNFDYEISKQLDQLYVYVYDGLVIGNIHSDVKYLQSILEIVQALKNAWLEAIVAINVQQTSSKETFSNESSSNEDLIKETSIEKKNNIIEEVGASDEKR